MSNATGLNKVHHIYVKLQHVPILICCYIQEATDKVTLRQTQKTSKELNLWKCYSRQSQMVRCSSNLRLPPSLMADHLWLSASVCSRHVFLSTQALIKLVFHGGWNFVEGNFLVIATSLHGHLHYKWAEDQNYCTLCVSIGTIGKGIACTAKYTALPWERMQMEKHSCIVPLSWHFQLVLGSPYIRTCVQFSSFPQIVCRISLGCIFKYSLVPPAWCACK